jgi:hypothetical protein
MTPRGERVGTPERVECTAPGRRTITGFTRYAQAIAPSELPKVDELAPLVRTSSRFRERPFGAYAAEQIAAQVEDHYLRSGRPSWGVLTVLAGKTPGTAVAENVASLDVLSFHRKSTPGAVFH